MRKIAGDIFKILVHYFLDAPSNDTLKIEWMHKPTNAPNTPNMFNNNVVWQVCHSETDFLQYLNEHPRALDVYWLPNFKGIDSIIGVGPNIYFIQITISKKHLSPLDALSKYEVKHSREEASRLGGMAAFLFVVDEAVRGKKLCLKELKSKRAK
jgi:hypothetical protein